MWNDILQLCKPIQFLCIRNSRAWLYQIILPVVFSALILFLQNFGQEKIIPFNKNDFVTQIALFLQILVPFNIAALAAVATFPSATLDKNLSGNPKPALYRKIRGELIKEDLTRRRFICLLFGYLTFLGIFILVLGIITPDIIRIISLCPWINIKYLNYGVIAIYAFLTGNLLTNTLLGLFYLSDRLHRVE